MSTAVPEKIQKIITDIESHGHASLTRLTVLKKRFEHPVGCPSLSSGLRDGRQAAKSERKVGFDSAQVGELVSLLTEVRERAVA